MTNINTMSKDSLPISNFDLIQVGDYFLIVTHYYKNNVRSITIAYKKDHRSFVPIISKDNRIVGIEYSGGKDIFFNEEVFPIQTLNITYILG